LHAADQFSLEGRVDRIVKLAEKRLSLSEVENLCRSLSFVRQAAALILSGSVGHGREQLALVVELTEAGQQLLAISGKHALNQQIKQALASRFETVLLPRRFRYVQSMPFNAQGKLPRQQLELLFLS
jgi:acyl-coenzyme A synthetase/AMP-(fatty) acid ligase